MKRLKSIFSKLVTRFVVWRWKKVIQENEEPEIMYSNNEDIIHYPTFEEFKEAVRKGKPPKVK